MSFNISFFITFLNSCFYVDERAPMQVRYKCEKTTCIHALWYNLLNAMKFPGPIIPTQYHVFMANIKLLHLTGRFWHPDWLFCLVLVIRVSTCICINSADLYRAYTQSSVVTPSAGITLKFWMNVTVKDRRLVNVTLCDVIDHSVLES